MDVFFERTNGKRLQVELWFFDTVLEMKRKIEKYHRIPVSKQTLVFNGTVMEDARGTEYYDVLQGSRIKLLVDPDFPSNISTKVHVTVNSKVTNRTYSVTADKADSVRRLKNLLENTEKVAADRIALSCRERDELEDDKALQDYGIHDLDIIHVALKPKPEHDDLASANANANTNVVEIMVSPMACVKKFPVKVDLHEKVSALRPKLELLKISDPQFSLPPEYFFIHEQNVMDEEGTFFWHDIKDGDIIEVFSGTVLN